MRLLLDSSACVAFLRDQPRGIRNQLKKWSAGEAGMSAIVLAELELGVALTIHQDAGRKALDLLTQIVPVLPWTEAAARIYGPMRASLQQKGQLIGPNDLLIAAHALALGLPLLTGNVREFKRVPGLEVMAIPQR